MSYLATIGVILAIVVGTTLLASVGFAALAALEKMMDDDHYDFWKD